MPAQDPNAPLRPADDSVETGEPHGAAATHARDFDEETARIPAPDADAADATGAPEGPRELDAVISRRVNLRTFLILGAVVGAIFAVILTYAFPAHPEFTRGQVLGFFLVFVTALTAVVFAAIGLILDAVVSRRRGTATIRRVRD